MRRRSTTGRAAAASGRAARHGVHLSTRPLRTRLETAARRGDSTCSRPHRRRRRCGGARSGCPRLAIGNDVFFRAAPRSAAARRPAPDRARGRAHGAGGGAPAAYRQQASGEPGRRCTPSGKPMHCDAFVRSITCSGEPRVDGAPRVERSAPPEAQPASGQRLRTRRAASSGVSEPATFAS